MIDGNTLINGTYAWPNPPFECKQIRNGILESVDNIEKTRSVAKVTNGNTNEIVGRSLVGLNTEMYKKICGSNNRNRREDIPSLNIVLTMDMGLAYSDGYKRVFKNNNNVEASWDVQVTDTELALITKPHRLLSLFSYDPRRYRLDTNAVKEVNGKPWDEPFARIAGYTNSNAKGIWLGFCMNPFLGFRPFDELCIFLSAFYKQCANDNIPILAHCAPDGIVTHRVMDYEWFDRENASRREEIVKKRNDDVQKKDVQNDVCSDIYRGKDNVFVGNNTTDGDDAAQKLDHFCRNYGHPRNWIPVLKRYPKLRLCLVGFGGNAEWGHEEMSGWDREDIASLQREWIRCIVKLTKYGNVYADISGLDIFSRTEQSNKVKERLKKMLKLIIEDNSDFTHLKYKLIFGTGWYLAKGDYEKYCTEFKNLLYTISENPSEKEKARDLWERISLINPWKFYALDENIEKLHNSLIDKNVRNVNVNSTMLEKMNDLLNANSELAEYISCRSNADPNWDDTQIPDDGDNDLTPCGEPENSNVVSTSLCSIFKAFDSRDSGTEKIYCFKKFHQQTYEGCDIKEKGCSQLILLEDETEPSNRCCNCADKIDGFSTLIDNMLRKMWDVMSVEDQRQSVSVEEMKRTIKNRLWMVRLIKDDGSNRQAPRNRPVPHAAMQWEHMKKSGIDINIYYGKNLPQDVPPEPAHIKKLVDTLENTQDNKVPIVELKFEAVLIHELRHVWQHTQPTNSSSEMWEKWGWLIKDAAERRDIMLEVDAFEIQGKFERRQNLLQSTDFSESTTKFWQVDKNGTEDNKDKVKAQYLWKRGYGDSGKFRIRSNWLDP